MKYTKLFRLATIEGLACAQIYADHYSCHYDHILAMVNELKKDFPMITDNQMQVQKYAGQHKKGTTFVEVFFKPSRHVSVPIGYDVVNKIESIL